jgi:Ca2+-transporting ATPase
MSDNPFPFEGLTDGEVIVSRGVHGTNALAASGAIGFWKALRAAITEPMLLLLLAAATIYFLLGQLGEAIFMVGAILLISAISFYQDHRSRRALQALQRFTHPKARAIRNNRVVELHSDDLVSGDLVVVQEGELVPADGRVVHANDFLVNQSILTGEAFPVSKEVSDDDHGRVYRGTQAVGGLAVARITAVGSATEIGRIGTSLATITGGRSPLERQMRRFVHQMAAVGAVFFLLVWGLNLYASGNWLDSLLKGLTLAMSILPEEIPVAFTSFMALGAWRMMRLGVLVKQANTVETLGAASVICMDKTGTITQNRMELAALQLPGEDAPRAPDRWDDDAARHLVATAMWASEPVPFDPMEIAIHTAYGTCSVIDRRPQFRMVHEYPLSGRPPMMTHAFANAMGERIIAAKGAPEAILACSELDAGARGAVMAQVKHLAVHGHRILAVGETTLHDNAWPSEQQLFTFRYLGLVAFQDPPKPDISRVFQHFGEAGIRTIIITGDDPDTAMAIARQVGFVINGDPVTGEHVQAMDDAALAITVQTRNLFTRMFPEAKLRVVLALKALGEVVAMTGDGVNDGPALKAAHIGIAMGRRGSELAKEAAALVLMDDDLGRMVDAVAQGRRIYGNLKKAIRYIITIHIPIILTVVLPLLFGWIYPNILTPLHVIFLELIMGPTCSIVFENEPLEPGSMSRGPRPRGRTFLTWVELRVSVLQGLVITAGTLLVYHWAVHRSLGEDHTRSLVFITLVMANITLTLVGRSFHHSMLRTLLYPNGLLHIALLATAGMLVLLVSVPFLRHFFELGVPRSQDLGLAVAAGALCVLWYELVKWWRRRRGAVSLGN